MAAIERSDVLNRPNSLPRQVYYPAQVAITEEENRTLHAIADRAILEQRLFTAAEFEIYNNILCKDLPGKVPSLTPLPRPK
jgi:hypothetical protein